MHLEAGRAGRDEAKPRVKPVVNHLMTEFAEHFCDVRPMICRSNVLPES